MTDNVGYTYNCSSGRRYVATLTPPVAECSPFCLECIVNGPSKCDPGKCSERTVYDSTSMTCKGIRTVSQWRHAMIDTSKTAKIIKRWYHSPSHRLTVNVLLNNITVGPIFRKFIHNGSVKKNCQVLTLYLILVKFGVQFKMAKSPVFPLHNFRTTPACN